MALKNKTERASNFELLRIIAMLAVTIFHYADHGCRAFITSIPFNSQFVSYLMVGGALGNIMFVLITGYFYIYSKITVRKVFRLWFQVFFYSAVIGVLCMLFGIRSFSWDFLMKILTPTLSNQYWFFTVYIVLILFSPYINSLLLSLNQKQWRYLLLTSGIVFSVFPTVVNPLIFPKSIYEPLFTSANAPGNLGIFLFLYILGAYIRVYDVSGTVRIKIKPVVFVILLLVICLLSVVVLKKQLFKDVRYFMWPMYKSPILLLSVFVFLTFKGIKMREIKWINWIAGSVFGVYLIHMNQSVFQWMWFDLLKIKSYYNSQWLPLHAFICMIVIFIACIIIDKIRIYLIEKPVERLLFKKQRSNSEESTTS